MRKPAGKSTTPKGHLKNRIKITQKPIFTQSLMANHKNRRIKQETTIATWNIQGKVGDGDQKNKLIKEMKHKNVQICCLQETKCTANTFKNHDGTLIFVDHPHGYNYGMGFYISSGWMEHIIGTESITNRISVIKFQLDPQSSKPKVLTIINAYAPHSQRTIEQPEELETFYEKLRSTYEKYKRTSFRTFIAGDMNAKIGQQQDHTECFLGKYGKGTRNRHGHRMAEFLIEHELFAANTAFQHVGRHQTTWTGPHRKGAPVYNQIDYFILQQELVHKNEALINSRSYENLHFSSDHKIVVTKVSKKAIYKTKHSHRRRKATPKYDVSKLAECKDTQERFSNSIVEMMKANLPTNNPAELYNGMVKSLESAAQACLAKMEPLDHVHAIARKYNEPTLTHISQQIKTLRINLQMMNNSTTIKAARRTKNKLNILRKKRIAEIQNDHLQTVARYLESQKGNKRCFEAQRMLQLSGRKRFKIIDEDGITLVGGKKMLQPVTTFYLSFFNQDGHRPIFPWMRQKNNDITPLKKPITAVEVRDAAMKMNNGKSYGNDGIPGEFWKYGGPAVHQTLADIFNGIFQTETPVPQLVEGILIPLNKPGKALTPNQTRPITLVNTSRKILSSIVLDRIYDRVMNFISINQSGFRRNRSTADMVWTYRWIMATTQKFDMEFHIMGIDLSKAFDCIHRELLIESLKRIIEEDELKIIVFLLSETSLQVKIEGEYGTKFRTTIGTPQGDALSPILFLIYLETAMRYHRNKQIERGIQVSRGHVITHYADDTDFISTSNLDHENTLAHLAQDLAVFNLKMNNDKTEHITVNRTSLNNLANKKLGSKLSMKLDMTHKINTANFAFTRLRKLFRNTKYISTETKLKMYSACILPIITYNMSSMALTDNELEKMNTTHRKHLRIMLGIFYPATIHNLTLYEQTKTQPITMIVRHMRMKLLGHILRGDQRAPAYQTMKSYFEYYENKNEYPKMGGHQSQIHHIINRDLVQINNELNSLNNLAKLTEQANDRPLWNKITELVMNCACKIWKQNEEVKMNTRRRRREEKEQANEDGVNMDTQPTRRQRRMLPTQNEEEKEASQMAIQMEIEEQFATADCWEPTNMEVDQNIIHE